MSLISENLGGKVSSLRNRVYRTQERLIHFGFNQQCPMCNASVRRFFPEGERHAVLFDLNVIGGGLRDGAICPICNSVDRERLVYLFLNERQLVKSGMRMMHVAPEAVLGGWLRHHIGTGYMSADLMANFVDQKVDLTDIPYPNGTFDAIICNHVLEHIPADDKAMSEVYRMLKPEGWAILQVPIGLKLESTIEDPSVTDPAERQRRFGQDDHIRIYAADNYVERLKLAGFDVEQYHWTDHPEHFGGLNNKYGLIIEEVLFFVCKRAV